VLRSALASDEMALNHIKEDHMDGWTTTMRELTPAETALVSGAFTWEGLGAAMLTGAIVGGLGAAATGAGVPIGALGGALLGGIGYSVSDLFMRCF
jgi:hypothetical protein